MVRERQWYWGVGALLLVASLAQMLGRYARIVKGPGEFVDNVTKVWRPVAELVLDGTPLYLDAAVDNKPPLFWFLNLLGYVTGHYEIVMFALVGIANGVAGCLIYIWISRKRSPQIATIAAVLFIATIPLVHGTYINVRSFAAVFILAALLTDRSLFQGIYLAAGAMFTQYVVFLIPLFLVKYYRGNEFYRDVLVATVGGISIIALSYGTVAIMWGPRAALSGLYWTYNVPVGQVPGVDPLIFAVKPPAGYFAQPGAPSVVGNTLVWGGFIFYRVGLLLHILPAALVGIYSMIWDGNHMDFRQAEFELDISLGAGLLMLPLFLRGHGLYWILPLPFLAAAASVGYGTILNGDGLFSTSSSVD